MFHVSFFCRLQPTSLMFSPGLSRGQLGWSRTSPVPHSSRCGIFTRMTRIVLLGLVSSSCLSTAESKIQQRASFMSSRLSHLEACKSFRASARIVHSLSPCRCEPTSPTHVPLSGIFEISSGDELARRNGQDVQRAQQGSSLVVRTGAVKPRRRKLSCQDTAR